jgi:hypothetical protein
MRTRNFAHKAGLLTCFLDVYILNLGLDLKIVSSWFNGDK